MMASLPNVNPAASDGGRRGAGAWNRRLDSRFEWVASSPSPAEIEALERRFPEVIQVPAQPLEDESLEWRMKAVIARSLSRWVPSEAILREFRRAGISGEVETVSLAHRHYLFRFADPLAKEKALARPWMANGQLIAMEEWRPQFVPSEGSVASALLWIRLPSLPIEYWSEEIISSIISVAGVFQYIDDATRERKRGGFARACVRVDLSKPLRPGARIGGSALPFWQQFVYEHLEGICAVCGSVHSAGSCLSSQADASTSDGVLFGPWMAALRRRRPATAAAQASKSKQGEQGTGQPDDWQIPKKTARRPCRAVVPEEEGFSSGTQAGSGCKVGSSGMFHGLGAAGQSGSGESSSAVPGSLLTVSTVGRHAVPVSVAAGKDSAMNQHSVISVNPFALLGSDKSTGRPRSRKEANPGPLKRARPIEPVESLAPRAASSNRKGKGKHPGKRSVQPSLTLPVPMAEFNGTETFRGFGSLSKRTTEARNLDGPSDGPQMMQEESLSHDNVVSLLNHAIQPKGTADGMDTPDQCPSEGVIPTTCSPVIELIGDVVGPPPSE